MNETPGENPHRRPAALDLVAGLLLVATVVVHVVGMFPSYFAGGSSLAAQTDQAALYAVLAASWALALAIGLTGPARTPVAAGLAAGIAVTEFGFRLSDLGQVIRYGSSTAGAGLWIMEAAWVVGLAAAVVSVLAARARHRRPALLGQSSDPPPASSSLPAEPEPVAAESLNPYGLAATESQDPTTVIPGARPEVHSGDTVSLHALHVPDEEDPSERWAWTLLVVILALLTAGAFLPAWDHAVAVSDVTGQSVTRSLGNAFSGPWQQVVGTVLAAVAMAALPIVAIRFRNRAVGAAIACGALLVLATQLVSAVVQIDQPVPPRDLGIGSAQAGQLGLHVSLQLTGWFTVDALAAYALFAAVMVWATLRPAHHGLGGAAGSAAAQANSGGTVPTAPDSRSEAISWGP